MPLRRTQSGLRAKNTIKKAYLMALQYGHLVFLATPRTASNSVFYMLREKGGMMLGDHHDIPTKTPTGMTTVGVVRNHFDWFVTSWIKATWRTDHDALKRMPFAEWLHQIHEPGSPLRRFTYPGYVRVAGPRGRLFGPLRRRCGILLRYETLEAELRQLLGDESITLPRWNATPHKRDYRKYYDIGTKTIIEEHYAPEMETFGYSYGTGRPWEPRDDSDALRGGGLFSHDNQRRPKLREYRNWPNLPNNPD